MSRYIDPNEKNYSKKFDDAIKFLIENSEADTTKNSAVELRDAVNALTEDRDIRSWAASDITKFISENTKAGATPELVISLCWHYFYGVLRTCNCVAAEDDDDPNA
jgi:hypothetical protein